MSHGGGGAGGLKSEEKCHVLFELVKVVTNVES
jgi:hypothetical protein